MREDGGAGLRIGCVRSDSERARVAFAEIEDRYHWVDPDDCDVLVALGGDGFLLQLLHLVDWRPQPQHESRAAR
jgi:NAD+ kinase